MSLLSLPRSGGVVPLYVHVHCHTYLSTVQYVSTYVQGRPRVR